MSYLVRNARRALLDTFEARNTVELDEVFTGSNRTNKFSTLEVLHAYCEVNGIECDWANEYGEPGYNTEKGVILTNWNRIPKSLADRVEAQGYACEYNDEWMVDYDNGGKAYRASPDGHGWEPRVRATDGDYLTPDSDPQEWIDDSMDEDRPLPSWFDESELEKRGFGVMAGRDKAVGYHPGQNETPDKFVPALRKEGYDVVLQVTDRGQFDVHYKVWTRREARTELLLSDARGIYIPRDFANSVHREMVIGVDAEDWLILEAGPEHEQYWDVWQCVLEDATITDSDGVVWRLDQNGDLWLIEAGGEFCEFDDNYYTHKQ